MAKPGMPAADGRADAMRAVNSMRAVEPVAMVMTVVEQIVVIMKPGMPGRAETGENHGVLPAKLAVAAFADNQLAPR